MFLRGDNFILRIEGAPERLGFYNTRYVQANSPEGAELLAVDLIRHDKRLAHIENSKDDPPMIFAEEIVEVDALDIEEGYTFFPADDNGSGEDA